MARCERPVACTVCMMRVFVLFCFLLSPASLLGQVAIGESTCSAKWFAGPLSDECDECNSMFDISELSRIALERASTARYEQGGYIIRILLELPNQRGGVMALLLLFLLLSRVI